MTFSLIFLALIWDLPVIVAMLVALATFISPQVKGTVMEVLFGAAT